MRVMYVLLTVQPHIILRDKIYFLDLTLTNVNVSTMSGAANLIEGSRRANIMVRNGTRFHIIDALYSSKSTRNLLSFKDIRRNGYRIETMNKGNNVFILPLLFMARNLLLKNSQSYPLDYTIK